MDEYISKEATIDAIKKIYCPQCNNYNGAMCRACEHMDDMDIIDDMPAADVQSVKHGMWKYYKNNGIINTYVCANCQGKVEMTIDAVPSEFKYCPNCGARMDGDSNV